MRIFSGLVWRHVPHGANALHLGWILRAAGRWNRQGVYGCLYAALTPEGALAEYEKYTAHAHGRRRVDTRDLVSIRVNRIGPVLDLTDAQWRAEAGVDLHTLTDDEPDDLETCRTVADWARSGGYQGLLVPSAAQPGEANLIIYIDGPVGNIDLDEGPDRRIIESLKRN
ncbi:MAG: RES family NAD+ phosphorylase [Gemmatimonadaceae bacterium]